MVYLKQKRKTTATTDLEAELRTAKQFESASNKHPIP